jgi:transposase
MAGLAERIDELRRLVRTDPDPRGRRRAQATLMLAQGESVLGTARGFRTAPHRVRAWRGWSLAGGRDRLADDPRCGRPPKLGAGDRAFLDDALPRGPEAYGWPVTVWSIRDLRELLRLERRVTVSVFTVHRAVWGLGYRYRRPKHDLTHRQDAAAVASAREALAWLGKGPALGAAARPAPFGWSIWTSARSTATPA